MDLKSLLRGVYNHSPYPIKNLMANVYGWNRYRWRFNHNTERLVNEAKEREEWSVKEWRNYTEQTLEKLLDRAARQVPYYQNYWAKRRKLGDNASHAYLENWPVVSKETVRQNALAFLADDCNPKKMYHEHTSGTSGKPVHVYWSKETTVSYYALFERRIRNWHGVNRNSRYAILGGQLIIPVSRNKPPYWVNNKMMNHLYLSSYHISERTIGDYVNALISYSPEYLFGYASSLYSLALLCSSFSLKIPPLKAVISNAEPLYTFQAELIQEVFKAKVVNTYGMSELVAAGCSKSDYTSMHLWPEVGILETLAFENNRSTNELGRFIGTSLINPDFCLIRYEVGDAGIIVPASGDGLSFPSIKEIEGRIDDMVLLRDGRRIGRLDPVFKGDFKIREAQIVQEELDVFVINVVPANDFSATDEKLMTDSLRERIGDVSVQIRKVDFIEKGPFGKFKAVVSKVKR